MSIPNNPGINNPKYEKVADVLADIVNTPLNPSPQSRVEDAFETAIKGS